MESIIIGVVLGLAIGFCCRWFDIPLPSPPNLVGALIVVSMTLGFVGTQSLMKKYHPKADEVEAHE
ncbi:MAG: DUF1427 family protein [Alphaproteobacteria bacterium]|jgi:XapX domain-containing protein